MAANIYTKGSPVDSDKDWYHGELTRVQAEKRVKTLTASSFERVELRLKDPSYCLSSIMEKSTTLQ